MAIETIPLGIGVALEFAGPLTLAVLTSRGRLDILWAALAALGIYLVLPHGGGGETLDPVGIALALGAGLMWALYIVFGQKLSADLPEQSAVALGMLFAVISTLPFALLLSDGAIFTLSVLPLAIAVAIFSSALPYVLEMLALKRLPVPVFSTLMSMEPAIATLSGLLFLGEYLSPIQMLAILCVIGASLGSSLSARAGVMSENRQSEDKKGL
nr:EamA family transporter [Govania unica]